MAWIPLVYFELIIVLIRGFRRERFSLLTSVAGVGGNKEHPEKILRLGTGDIKIFSYIYGTDSFLDH